MQLAKKNIIEEKAALELEIRKIYSTKQEFDTTQEMEGVRKY